MRFEFPTRRSPVRRRPSVLEAAPFALPAALDTIAERWWDARPRSRLAVIASSAVLAISVGLLLSGPASHDVKVMIAARDLAPGDAVTASDISTAWWPVELVPDGVVDRPTGVITAPVPHGAVITELHMGDGGVGARLPPDRRAVAVAAEHLPPLDAGTRLDVVAAAHDGSGVVLSRSALVLATDGDVAWLSVDAATATAVSAAAVAGRIAAVVHPA